MGSLAVSAVASAAAGVQGQSEAEAAVLGQAWLLALEWMGLQELGLEQLAWVQPA